MGTTNSALRAHDNLNELKQQIVAAQDKRAVVQTYLQRTPTFTPLLNQDLPELNRMLLALPTDIDRLEMLRLLLPFWYAIDQEPVLQVFSTKRYRNLAWYQLRGISHPSRTLVAQLEFERRLSEPAPPSYNCTTN
jgi:hypothetical protein